MACRDSVVRMTGPTCGDHIPGARDQAALGTHTAKGRATDELYRDKKILYRDRLLKVFCRDRESRNMGFPMSRHGAYVTIVHGQGAWRQSALSA